MAQCQARQIVGPLSVPHRWPVRHYPPDPPTILAPERRRFARRTLAASPEHHPGSKTRQPPRGSRRETQSASGHGRHSRAQSARIERRRQSGASRPVKDRRWPQPHCTICAADLGVRTGPRRSSELMDFTIRARYFDLFPLGVLLLVLSVVVIGLTAWFAIRLLRPRSATADTETARREADREERRGVANRRFRGDREPAHRIGLSATCSSRPSLRRRHHCRFHCLRFRRRCRQPFRGQWFLFLEFHHPERRLPLHPRQNCRRQMRPHHRHSRQEIRRLRWPRHYLRTNH
jgi:hypothetical protein